jgi:uroporphyrinogen-III synthase
MLSSPFAPRVLSPVASTSSSTTSRARDHRRRGAPCFFSRANATIGNARRTFAFDDDDDFAKRRRARCRASSSSDDDDDGDDDDGRERAKKNVVVLTREAGKNEQMRKIVSQPPFGENVSVLEMPLVESVPAEDAERLRETLETKQFQWIIVTSPEAAKVFTNAWVEAGKPEGLNIGTVGGGTTRALPSQEEMKWARLFTPTKALGEVVAEELPLDLDDGDSKDSKNSNREVLYPCSKKAAKTIQNGLSSRGFTVTRLNTYSTEQVTDIPKDVLEKAVEANVVTFGSPSAVKAWKSLTLDMLEERGGKHPTYACIGQTSANACEDCELPDVWHPENPGMEGWAEVVKLCLEQDESEKWRGIL